MKQSRWSKKYVVPEEIGRVPKGPGCYAVYFGNDLVYVGSSYQVRNRLSGHRFDSCRYSAWTQTPWGSAAKVTVKVRATKKYGEWLMLEARLLRRLAPRHNVRGKRGASHD